ncbi:MAG: hypothetical protein NW205_10250 [Hyphomicrobiaceae bacterium]|nr:hypothetical protein [Hyphomicrobiaceae bacterium]
MQKNPDNSAAMGLAVLCAVVVMVLAVIAFILAFVSFVLTILCLMAWHRPLTLGNVVIEPAEARDFVMSGLVFAALVPAFVAVMAALFREWPPADAWVVIAAGGYVFGSLGYARSLSELAHDNHSLPGGMTLPAPAAEPATPASTPTPSGSSGSGSFRFATWDDEEVRRA